MKTEKKKWRSINTTIFQKIYVSFYVKIQYKKNLYDRIAFLISNKANVCHEAQYENAILGMDVDLV